MTIEQIREKCNEITCNPSENLPTNILTDLVIQAKTLNFALEFHVGHNLLYKPYIQGYTLEPINLIDEK